MPSPKWGDSIFVTIYPRPLPQPRLWFALSLPIHVLGPMPHGLHRSGLGPFWD